MRNLKLEFKLLKAKLDRKTFDLAAFPGDLRLLKDDPDSKAFDLVAKALIESNQEQFLFDELGL